jgi:hypothetical protein
MVSELHDPDAPQAQSVSPQDSFPTLFPKATGTGMEPSRAPCSSKREITMKRKHTANALAVPSKTLDCTQKKSRSRASVSETLMRGQVDDVPEVLLTPVARLWKKGLNDGDLLRVMLMTISTQLYRLPGQINQAFAGKAFIIGVPPDHPVNQRRFNAYVSDLAGMVKLLEQFAETASIVHEKLARPHTNRKNPDM